jgi:hypothetical protein
MIPKRARSSNLSNMHFKPAKIPHHQQVRKLAESMKTWAGSGFLKVQNHVYEKRMAICRKCEFWEENARLGYGKCKKCGCGKGKHWLPHEQCPIGLWGKETP